MSRLNSSSKPTTSGSSSRPPPQSHRRLVSDETIKIGRQLEQISNNIIALVDDDSDNYIQQLLDLLEETRNKWCECEKDNVRLAAQCKTLQEEAAKNQEEAATKIEKLTDLLKNARAQISSLAIAKQKAEEQSNRYRRQIKNSVKENSPRSTLQAEEISSIIATMDSPIKNVRRSNSVPVHLRRHSSASSSHDNTSLILHDKASSAATSPPAVSLCISPPKMSRAPSFGNLSKIDLRQHLFETKRLFLKNTCQVCSQPIKFGVESSKCTVCKAICHQDCRPHAAIPCIPFFAPPKSTNGRLRLGEYCSDEIVPKLPHLIIRCVQYLKTHLSHAGLYVDLSRDADAELLLKLILVDRNPATVEKFGPNVAAHCILKFLASLRESLILESSIAEFSIAANCSDDASLEMEISELPIVHKNTLAYLVLHWKLLLQENDGISEELLGRSVLPAIMRITISEISNLLPVFYRLLSLSNSFWHSVFDITLSRASSKKLKGGTPYALTVAKLQEQQDARSCRHSGQN